MVDDTDEHVRLSGDILEISLVAIVITFLAAVVIKFLYDAGAFEGFIESLELNGVPRVRKLNSASFKKNKFKDYCGVEIECISTSDDISKSLARKLNFRRGTDSSISYGGQEFRSMPSRGDRLFKIIKNLCKELVKNDYKVNHTCGLHLHIETKRDLELLKKLYVFYSKYENLFFKMLPKSRQGNEHCLKFNKVDKYSISEIKKVTTLKDFMKLYYEREYFSNPTGSHGYKKRYCWCNFHSIFYRGTFEIRSHSGTIDSNKITKWILIHLYIRDFLNKKDIDFINKLPVNMETFLKIFPVSLRKYIRLRWAKFPATVENKFMENVKNVSNPPTIQAR